MNSRGDWTVLAFDGAGNVRHVTHASYEYAGCVARSMRRHYTSVRIVTHDEAMHIIDAAKKERYKWLLR